jgi:hypothetical protein
MIAALACGQQPPGPSAELEGRQQALNITSAPSVRKPGPPVGTSPASPGRDSGRLSGGTSRAASCDIDFNYEPSLLNLPDSAKTTFAINPWWRQPCPVGGGTDAWLRPVVGFDHYHLMYEDPVAAACVPFFEGEDCAFDPAEQPRYLMPMSTSDWLSLAVYQGEKYTSFNVSRLTVTGAPIKLCYKKPAQGPWVTSKAGTDSIPGLSYCWDKLDPGFVWDISDWAFDIVEVRITGAGDSLYELDDLVITVP